MTGPALPLPHRRVVLAFVALGGVLISVVTWQTVRSAEELRISANFRRRAETQAQFVRERLQLYEEMMHNLHTLFAYSRSVTRQEFDAAAAGLLQRHSGVQALQWVEHVERADLPAFVARARADYGRFDLIERRDDGFFVPLQERPFHYVIRLAAPLAGNERALGYDINTAPSHPALEVARTERRLVVTQPFQLVQSLEDADEYGVVFAMPVFATGDPARLRGFVQGVFRVRTMLALSHQLRPDDALLIHYTDLDAPESIAWLYANHAGLELASPKLTPAADGLPTYRELLRPGGRRWQMFVQMNPEWRARQRTLTPPLVLLGGLITAFVGTLALNGLLRRTAEIEKQVTLRTGELQRTQRELEVDIERRRAAELALQASEERLQAILDHSPAAIFVKDLDGRYLLCNREFERDSGLARAQVLGRTDHELFSADAAATFVANDRRVLAAGSAFEFEEVYASAQGPRTNFVQKFPLKDAGGRCYAVCGIATDITDRLGAEREKRELERRLQEKQKLESLGVLAGGIAHDFNNILTAVLGNASLVRALLPGETPVAPQLVQIENAARRAADLCTQMLAYAGKGNLVPGDVNLSDLVRDTAALLEVSISKSTRLQRHLGDGLPAVHADATQLRQIVMNLVINAAEAIGERAGEITLSTFSVHASSELLHAAVQHPDLPAGLYVALEVRDTGAGMPPETLARIFEPFFTTKFSGRGLGLSAVLGIVRSHRGALFVESHPGVGSTFRLLLPASRTTPAPAAPSANANGAAQAPRLRLDGTVLLVDDETHVRQVTALALRSVGLDVLEACNGQEALAHSREHPEMIDLILLDLTMPGLSGEETLRRLRMQGTRQKVILMSGYSENEATHRCMQLGAVAFVQKPFELDRLFQLLTDHLPGGQGASRAR